MTRSGAPTDWEASLGKFCEVPECTSLAKHIIDGEYRCGRHTKSGGEAIVKITGGESTGGER